MNVVAMLLAGGQGSRLSILSQRRAKPAVPFGGSYRIIDFTLSNIMNARIPYVGILTQYRPSSLMDHVGNGGWWGFTGRHRTCSILPPYQGEADSDWYAGTADAIYQNRSFMNQFHPDYVVILSGDHIYQMDYERMIDQHVRSGAALTIAVQRVPWEETSRFGLVDLDDTNEIRAFQEKPKSDPVSNLASLGIYVFTASTLMERLAEDAANPDSSHDFGNDVIPGMLGRDKLCGFLFEGYWRDVGTIDSLWATNMECLDPMTTGLDLAAWNLRTNYVSESIAADLPGRFGSSTNVSNSLISRGCVVEGTVERSILFPGARVAAGAVVRDSIVMNGTTVGPGSNLASVIIDKDCTIGANVSIGDGENRPNEIAPHLLDTGITVLGKNVTVPDGAWLGKNVLVHPGVSEAHFTSARINSGATLRLP